MLYADDLTLTANDPVQLQKMLRRLESYAARKGLTVNVQKSYIVILNAYRNSAVPVFRPTRVFTIRSLKREILLPTWECYLISTWILHHAASHALRPFNAALRRVKEFGIEISDRPHAMLWLFKTYVVSWHVCQSDLVYAISEAWQWFQQPFAGRTHGVFNKKTGN